jgi:hypothetical protein
MAVLSSMEGYSNRWHLYFTYKFKCN